MYSKLETWNFKFIISAVFVMLNSHERSTFIS